MAPTQGGKDGKSLTVKDSRSGKSHSHSYGVEWSQGTLVNHHDFPYLRLRILVHPPSGGKSYPDQISVRKISPVITERRASQSGDPKHLIRDVDFTIPEHGDRFKQVTGLGGRQVYYMDIPCKLEAERVEPKDLHSVEESIRIPCPDCDSVLKFDLPQLTIRYEPKKNRDGFYLRGKGKKEAKWAN